MSLEHALTALLFFLPAGIANMAPIFASRLPLLRKWDAPLDLGKTYHGHRVFGPHKTWRGLVFGTIMGTLTGVILLSDSSVWLCASMSAGALLGDAIESFFKRQRGIASGKAWFPFDQTDYIIGGLLATLPFGVLPLWLVLWVFAIYFGLHLVSSYIGYLLGFKKTPI